MRIARSVSPRRRNRLPRAKCSSTVSGSTLTTSIKASIALSGCSFSKKLRPLKYERGSCRDSERSEEHTSELQSPCNLVCRLLLEKKKNITRKTVQCHKQSCTP